MQRLIYQSLRVQSFRQLHKMMLFAVLLALLSADDACAYHCACATSVVNVRSGSGTNFHIYATLSPGNCVTYKGHTSVDDGFDWINVDFNGNNAWIARDYVYIRQCNTSNTSNQTIDCSVGNHSYSSRGTAYYPSIDSKKGGFADKRGVPLKSLQDFVEGRAYYVSVAMDERASIQYGTHVCIPELNRKYRTVIDFRVVDTRSAFDGKGYGYIDICVRSESHIYDDSINNHLTLVFP